MHIIDRINQGEAQASSITNNQLKQNEMKDLNLKMSKKQLELTKDILIDEKRTLKNQLNDLVGGVASELIIKRELIEIDEILNNIHIALSN